MARPTLICLPVAIGASGSDSKDNLLAAIDRLREFVVSSVGGHNIDPDTLSGVRFCYHDNGTFYDTGTPIPSGLRADRVMHDANHTALP